MLGVFLNDMWRLFGSEVMNKTKNEYIPFINQDEFYQHIVALLIAGTSLIPELRIYQKVGNNVSLGIGTSIGSRYANSSEQGNYIGLVRK